MRSRRDRRPRRAPPAVRVWVKENPRTRARFYFVRHFDGASSSNDVTPVTIDVPDGRYPTSVRVGGRDFKILAAGHDLLHQRLVYSTSEILTHADAGDRLGNVSLEVLGHYATAPA